MNKGLSQDRIAMEHGTIHGEFVVRYGKRKVEKRGKTHCHGSWDSPWATFGGLWPIESARFCVGFFEEF